MGMIRLAFTLRFIVYTLSILLTAALLLTVVAYPPAIDLAAVPLVVFAGFTVLGTREEECLSLRTTSGRHWRAAVSRG